MQHSFQQCQNFLQNILALLFGECHQSWFWTNHVKSRDWQCLTFKHSFRAKNSTVPLVVHCTQPTSGSQPGVIFPPGNLSRCLETYLIVTLGSRRLLAPCGERPGVPRSSPQCPGQFPTAKDYPAQNVNSATIEKPWRRSTADFRWQSLPWKIQVLINPESSDSKFHKQHFEQKHHHQKKKRFSFPKGEFWGKTTHLISRLTLLVIKKVTCAQGYLSEMLQLHCLLGWRLSDAFLFEAAKSFLKMIL